MIQPAITIDKDHPIPTTRRRTIYPFGEMVVGDSFWSATKAAAAAAHVWAGRRPGVKFATRADGDGTRIWRLV